MLNPATGIDDEEPTGDEETGGPAPNFFAPPPAAPAPGGYQVTQDSADPNNVATLSRVGGGSVYTPDDEAIARASFLKRMGLSPGDVAASSPTALSATDARNQALRAAANETPTDRLSHQYDEILNEKRASNEADAQFGDPMAARALSRAMAARTGMQRATDESLLTLPHEQVMRNATEDALARAQPKEDTANEANQVKLQIATMQTAGKITAAQAADLSRTADALYGAGAHIAGSGYGATEPGQQMLQQIQQALQARQGGAGGAGGTPQYKAGQYKEGQTGTGPKGEKYVWHDAGTKGPNWYPSQ